MWLPAKNLPVQPVSGVPGGRPSLVQNRSAGSIARACVFMTTNPTKLSIVLNHQRFRDHAEKAHFKFTGLILYETAFLITGHITE
jgi:hypothetical protein